MPAATDAMGASGYLANDALSWMEDMQGPQWREFVSKEKAAWNKELAGLSSGNVALCEALSATAMMRGREERFEAAGGRVRIAALGTLSYTWRWDGAGATQVSCSDLEACRGDRVWDVQESGDGGERYTVAHHIKGRHKPVWSHGGVGPYVAVVGERVYCLEAKNTLVYWRLVSWRASDGGDRQIHYEEKDYRYNLELLRGSTGHAWLRRQSGPKQDLFCIQSSGISVLEGIRLESRRFVIGCRAGEVIVWEAASGWRQAGGQRKFRLPAAGTPESFCGDRGLLVTTNGGRRSLWRIGKTAQPVLLWRGFGTITIDPWDGPWVRLMLPGQPAVWWDSSGKDKKPDVPIPWCREVVGMSAKSADGTRVPFVLVRPTPAPGARGLLVIAYSAYGLPTPLGTARWEPLLSAGWALAIGFFRGGGDHTPAWADAGRLAGRIRTLQDAEAVVRAARDATNVPAARTVLYGRSAGGLWVGGMCAKFPDGSLAGGAYMEVPYLDVVRTISNPTLPLTLIETDEFGLPAQRPSDLASALRWSPMELLPANGTPGMWQLVRTAANDRQVFAYESAKWVVRSRGRRRARNQIHLAFTESEGHFNTSHQAEDVAWIQEQHLK